MQFKMASTSGRVDEFVKDYLLYRGLSSTLKALDIELKNEKEKGFRVYSLDSILSFRIAFAWI